MRWTPGGERSRNLEDRRASGMRGRAVPIGIGGVVLLGLLSLVTGRDLLTPALQEQAGQPQVQESGAQAPLQTTPEEEKRADFVSFVLDDVQGTWPKVLGNYRPARLVLFRGATESGCGIGQSAMGPFYCPADQSVYLDLEFFDELDRRFGAPGDFAQAYVIAHEIGHHIQQQLGTNQKVRAAQERNPGSANALSVRLELQADCYAGIWGHSTASRQLLDQGDIEEGLQAASSIGDDTLTGGRVRAENFTHGTAAQRTAWLKRGLQTGQMSSCDTFASGT
ncbi:MAG: KPN_02809 family neutral zinc metallopeptidase [Luteitalea sp.]